MSISLPVNHFKRRLATDQQTGLWVGLANAYCAEIAATAGFDWLLLDGEHAPNDLNSILAQLQAVAPYSTHPIVRPPSGDIVFIKQLLDIGAQTLLIPMVETAEQARELVQATRYPPIGVRGVGAALARASRWNGVEQYLHTANQEICLLLQIESVRALEHLDEILAIDGVDGIFIGPADLSASMGHLGNPTHPEVQTAIRDSITRIRQAGKATGILTTQESMAKQYFEMGCAFVAVGIDTSLLSTALRQLAKRFIP